MRVDILETSHLGDRSYVVSDGSVALVVDPQRDLDRVEALLAELGVEVRMVVETHLHNDYVTGGHALARRTGATYVVAGRDEVAFERCAAHDGDELTVGELTVRVIETPGHTDTHLAYVVTDHTGGAPAVFSGGSLLYGSVGRTDLLGTDRTDDLTRKQWRSARRLAKALPDDAALFPTHGFGSFCSSGGASGGSDSTIGQEKRRNDALTEDDEQSFVDKLVAGLTSYPAYYAHMGALNAQGPDEPDLTPVRTLDPSELAARIRTGEWVVDLRDRKAYAGQHLAGTVSIGIGTQFSTYAGWVIPWGSPITVIGESPSQVAQAQRQLVRIGIDHLAGSATGELISLAPDVPVRSYQQATFADMPDVAHVLDVRRDDEVKDGHIRGAKHIPLHSLVDRLHEVPRGKVWVHCASGYRASIAASILDRAGHEVVHLDDDFDNAEKAGLQVVRP
ncbi:MAG: MBL fold metallo-hydrolase [Mycobacteriales bacterium]|nr:MBL fold metallo-hydrolase [Mycobacteriales bacterium]